MLNEKDRNYLFLLAQGLTKKEIARLCGMKTYGVNNRARRVHRLLEDNNAPSAVAKAIALGVIDNPFTQTEARLAA